MTFPGVRWAPVVPERRPEPSDRAWIGDYQRRHRAARLRRYNRVAAAEVENPNTQLSRAMQEMNLRAERRAVGRGRVRRLLADAALANDVKRYREDRWETLALIERLEGRPGRIAAISRSARSTEHTGPDCRVCAEARRMEAPRPVQRTQATSQMITRVSTGPLHCSGCGALQDWCRCG